MLSDLTKKEMQEFVKNLGLPAFRGQQLFDGIYAGKSLSEITVLPKVLPKEIIDNYPKYKIERKGF